MDLRHLNNMEAILTLHALSFVKLSVPLSCNDFFKFDEIKR